MGFSSTEYENRYGRRRRSGSVQSGGSQSFSVTLDLAEFDDMLAGIEEDVEAAVRPAAQAGAQVLYDAVLRNVATLGTKTGLLEHSIYQAYSEDKSAPGKAVYHVSWNAKKAPHGHLVENGYIKKYQVVLTSKGKWITLKNKPLANPVHIPGKHFVGRAQDQFPKAYEAMRAEFLRRIGA